MEEEGNYINKSLMTLGRIFSILADRSNKKKEIPPYRDSKLTMMLKDSLDFKS